jgi:hypothetical protein
MAKKTEGLPYMSDAKRERIAKKKPSLFGLPNANPPKYPLTEGGAPSKRRAKAAKQRASQQIAMGNLSSSQKASIDAKADKILDGKIEKHLSKGKR